MDAGKLFSELVNRQADQTGGILTGTAVSDSVDGTVMVQMDGSVVAQPGEDEVTLTVSADDFADGSYVLPSVPYAGSLTITDSGGNELEEQDYELDGARLTIFALSSSPIDIAYQTQVLQQVTNEDFDGDRYSLASTTNLSVEEMASDGSWSPATYTLDGNILTIAGIEHQAGIVEFAYVYDVSQVCEPGENVLPDSPDEVSVLGRNSSGVDVVVTDYVLDGNVISLPSTYDAYTVDYPVTTTEEWNVSDQYQEEPLEDSDDAADPAIVTIGHNLQWPPASVVSCTIDGTAATYMLDDVNVVVDAPAVTERWFRLTYDAPVSLQVPASVFATGAFTLPSIPLGSVSTIRAGIVLSNTVDDDQLTIASLVVDSPTYSIAYTEQVEQDVVELPCTPYVAEGQFVEIAVVNGMPTVIGASGSGDVTMTLAGDAADAAAAAEAAATAAQEVAEAVSQHFWEDGQGIHVTEVTEEEWNDQSGASYHSGANVLISSIGQLFRTGLNNLLGFVTNPTTGVAIFDGLGNAAANVVGLFTADGVTLGREAESHAEVGPYSLRLVDEDGTTYFRAVDLRGSDGYITITEEFEGNGLTDYFDLQFRIAESRAITVTVDGVETTEYELLSRAIVSPYAPAQNLEIEEVLFDSAPADGAAIAVTYESDDDRLKAYTFGLRRVSRDVAPMSVAEGYITTASGLYSHAEGDDSWASGEAAHAEGDGSRASGTASHAEGGDTVASGTDAHAEGERTSASHMAAHAEGWRTTAGGIASHAQNRWTIANGDFQTALGRYNVADTTSAVILGNGTSDTARSNALTVDWSGNVSAAGDVSATGGTFTGTVSGTTGTFSGAVSGTTGTFTGAVSANGATLTDNVTLYDGAGSLAYRSRSELLDRDSGTAPSSWQYADGLELHDKDDETIGRVYTAWNTSNAMGTGIEAITEDSNGNEVINFLRVWANKDGTKTFSVGDRDNFRSAISAARASWVSLGSFKGTNSLTIDLTDYNEVMVAAKYDHTYNSQTSHKLLTAVVAKQLLTSTAQELWLGGGKSSGSTANSGALRAIVNITTTKVTGVISSADSIDHTSGTTWYVYAR